MTEQKKDYILDALSEVKDDFVAEAVSYTKQKAGWKYWRELGAVAACAAAVFVTVKTVEYLPISRTTENAVVTENMSQANDIQPEMFLESQKREEIVAESAMVEDKEMFSTNETVECLDKENETYSEGIEWTVVEDYQNKSVGIAQALAENKNVQESLEKETIGVNESISSSIMSWLSAEEILDQGNDIFRGVVTELQVYHVTGKINQYFTVATVEVTDSIRGTQQNGETCKIYLPVAKVDDMIMVNSVSGDLDKLEVGSSAIFMPRTATETTGLGKKDLGEWLCYADFADYYFSEATRYLFLETESGVSYEKNVYEIPGENITLDDVAEYLRKMLEN